MPFVFKYTYDNYPFSPKATARSKQLGIATCPTFCVVATIVFFLIFFAGFMATETGMVIGTILAFASIFLGKQIRKKLAVKVEDIAMADLLALRDTDPEAYREYAAVFWQELQRYQNANRYQAPYAAAAQPRQEKPVYQSPAPVEPQPAPREEPPQVIEMPETMPQPTVQEESPAPAAEAAPAADPEPVQEPPVQEKNFCGKCGARLKPDSAFCHRCGSKI